ncbi:carboxy-terminal region remorin [Medicago truncatula]|uniref:Carboxy-terminal region remorin n=1 Tax=Medicago truncatula TaxID=3880 RepID=G7KDE5_MEDTR|nr:carboxy-terminal region remorin [Medicago truncatula]
MGESEGSSINKTESPQLQSLLDPVPEELSPVVEKDSETLSTISISQEPNQQAISTLDDQKVADDHADNKETGDHDDKKDAKDSTDRDAGLAKIVAEKRLALIKAWEESEKTKAENRAYKKQSSVGLWEESKKSSIEAQLKKFEVIIISFCCKLGIFAHNCIDKSLESCGTQMCDKFLPKVLPLLNAQARLGIKP